MLIGLRIFYPLFVSGTLDNILSTTSNSQEPSGGQRNITMHNLKLQTVGIIGGLVTPPFYIRMCPPLTVKNFRDYRPLLAVGATNGNIQVKTRGMRSFQHTFTVTISFGIMLFQFFAYFKDP